MKSLARSPMIIGPMMLIMTISCTKKPSSQIKSIPSELNGSWTSACLSDASGLNSKATITFNGSEMAQELNYFPAADTNCSSTAEYTINGKSTFATGSELKQPAGAKEINISLTSIHMTVRTQEMVTQFNGIKLCGFSDWTINATKDLTAAACGEGADPMKKNIYDIFLVQDGTLKTGEINESHDASSPSKRPDTLSTKNNVYKKN